MWTFILLIRAQWISLSLFLSPSFSPYLSLSLIISLNFNKMQIKYSSATYMSTGQSAADWNDFPEWMTEKRKKNGRLYFMRIYGTVFSVDFEILFFYGYFLFKLKKDKSLKQLWENGGKKPYDMVNLEWVINLCDQCKNSLLDWETHLEAFKDSNLLGSSWFSTGKGIQKNLREITLSSSDGSPCNLNVNTNKKERRRRRTSRGSRRKKKQS